MRSIPILLPTHAVLMVSFELLFSTTFPIMYAAHITGMAANQPEKNENTNPIYRFLLNVPHQFMILFTVPNMLPRLLSDHRQPSVLRPHEPATFSHREDNSQADPPAFPSPLCVHL